MDAVLAGVANVFTPEGLLVLLIGTVTGMLVGALPGLSSTMAVALLIPVTFSMSPENSLILLGAVYVSSVYGGSVTAILLRTPGTDASIATSLDGYPLTAAGRGAEALGMATVASLVGGTVSVIVLLAVAPPLSRMALIFGPQEYTLLAVLGMVTIIGVVSEKPLNGAITALAGLFLATVGLDSFTGEQRYTLGMIALFDGVPLLPALIGLFSVSQAIALSLPRYGGILRADATPHTEGRALPAWSDLRRCARSMLKSSGIGTLVGILPGAGTSIAAFIAYDEARRTSRNAANFGKGELEGVAAPEAANNAVTGGTLIPTLTLGIPGNAVTAVFIGGLTIHGMIPGPRLFTEFADVTYTLIISLFVANILFAVIGLSIGRYLVLVTRVPGSMLGPMILVFSLIGTYALRNNMFDAGLALAFGFVGFFMERWRYPAAPFVIALILGPILEVNFRRSMQIANWDMTTFLTRPLSLLLMLLIAAAILYPVIKRRRDRWSRG